jgi:hypothetical protein
MPEYAHALIETENGRIERGEEVPQDLPGIEELRESGAVSSEPYEPQQDENPPPEEITIDGVRYVRAQDGATSAEVSDAA